MEDIVQFIYDSGEKWRVISTELRCVQAMLEEVLGYWRHWTPVCSDLKEWLKKANEALNFPDDERLEFFQVFAYCYSLVRHSF